jgi:Zn-dependent protease with chaperone function
VAGLTQTDAELQFVIAHELAHLELGHPAARLEQVAQAPGASVGLLPALEFLIALGYSDEQ